MLNKLSLKKILYLMILPIGLSSLYATENGKIEISEANIIETENVFNNIYTTKAWGEDQLGHATSGFGSKLETTDEYRTFLQNFMQVHSINSVVDVGCGIWDHMKALNWDGIEYYGYDPVQMVIERNLAMTKGTSSVNFILANVLSSAMPKADLLICKDLMQHLPLEEIQAILNLAKDYKYCIFVNDIVNSPEFTNEQITKGEYRPVDLTKAPFNLSGEAALTYTTGYTTKQVFVIQN